MRKNIQGSGPNMILTSLHQQQDGIADLKILPNTYSEIMENA